MSNKRLFLLFFILFNVFAGCNSPLRYGLFQTYYGGVSKVAFLPDGRHIVTASYSNQSVVSIWDAQTGEGKKLDNSDGDIRDLAVSPDGKWIAAQFYASGRVGKPDFFTLRLYNLQNDQIRNLTKDILVEKLAFTADSTQLITSGFLINGELGHTTRISSWNIQTGESRLIADEKVCWGLSNSEMALSPDGKTIVASCTGESLILINVQDGSKRILSKTDVSVSLLAFSPKGDYVASKDGPNIRLWNVQTGEMKILGECKRNVSDLEFSPDGKYVVSGDETGSVQIWSIESGKSYDAGKCKEKGFVSSVAFSPNGKSLVASCVTDDNSIHLWSIEEIIK